nr:MAG TPA: hypothetical protein [Caudoviricetes sp.]
MTIDCIRKRTEVLQHLWYEHHNKKICDILLNQLTNDIVFFLGVKLPKDLEDQLDQLDKEIHK